MTADPEKTIRVVVNSCTDCDTCRYLMEDSCLVFPEIYRLWDREQASGEKISSGDLRKIVNLCNFCALCPCPNIRADIMKAKAAFIERDGLPANIRLVEDVALLGRLCGTMPQLTNALFRSRRLGGRTKQLLGLHPQRNLPQFPAENFSTWAKRKGLTRKPELQHGRKVVYFSGCTANVFFPEVAKAAVSLLQSCGVTVWYPPQKCCGMPTFLEGDRKRTLQFIQFNLSLLTEAVADGFDIVCSCPTCGYMLKNLLKEGAYYSSEYQASVNAGADTIVVPGDPASGSGYPPPAVRLKKAIYGKILLDDGYFAGISVLQRISVAEHTMDLGQYLLALQRSGEMPMPDMQAPRRMVYFAPCHLREQNIGLPYLDLLKTVSEYPIESVGGSLYCCGMAGIMGCKTEFYEKSLFLGRSLLAKLNHLSPEQIVTDCLSCRLQFMQTTLFPVFHPLEVLSGAAAATAAKKPSEA